MGLRIGRTGYCREGRNILCSRELAECPFALHLSINSLNQIKKDVINWKAYSEINVIALYSFNYWMKRYWMKKSTATGYTTIQLSSPRCHQMALGDSADNWGEWRPLLARKRFTVSSLKDIHIDSSLEYSCADNKSRPFYITQCGCGARDMLAEPRSKTLQLERRTVRWQSLLRSSSEWIFPIDAQDSFRISRCNDKFFSFFFFKGLVCMNNSELMYM